MQSLNLYLANRLEEVLLNGKWVANTNLKTLIIDIDYTQANQIVGNLNSIAALTFHINYYLKGINHFFECGNLTIKDKYSFDMKQITNEADWKALTNEVLTNAEKLIDYIKNLDTNLWNQPFVKQDYGSYQRNIDAQIEHCYYHIGQISLIKKLLIT